MDSGGAEKIKWIGEGLAKNGNYFFMGLKGFYKFMHGGVFVTCFCKTKFLTMKLMIYIHK